MLNPQGILGEIVSRKRRDVGSDAIGIFADFLDDDVALIGVEAAGKGLDCTEHSATLLKGRQGILHGAETLISRTRMGKSATAGRSRPGSIIRPSAPSTPI